MISVLVLAYACDDDIDDVDYATYPLSVQLTYPAGSEFTAVEGVAVHLVNTITGTVFDTVTNATGRAEFLVPAGLYEVSATDVRSVDGAANIFNGLRSNITVSRDVETPVIELTLSYSKSGQVLTKELYVGGCPTADGKVFQFDKYVILYNNSAYPASLDNIAFGMILPANSTGANAYYDTEGHLVYENEDWIPAGSGLWEFTSSVTLDPWSQVVVNINGAIDNTITQPLSINFNNPDYYCMHDPDAGYNNTNYHPAPVNTIPTSHYLKAYKYGTGNAYVMSTASPGFFIFTKGMSLQEFVSDTTYVGPVSSGQVSKKLPVEWIVDGVEAFKFGSTNRKRFTAAIDAGYIMHNNGYGYSIYRNVDKTATEALPENAGKLVYNYSLGTAEDEEGTTDPSGIDAEASIRNGAHIVYKDTNNSSNDFHQRKQASLRGQ
jgi:hypothetical protein